MADQRVDEVISEKAFEQVERLITLLVSAENRISEFNRLAKEASFDIKGARNLADFSSGADKAANSIENMSQASRQYQTYSAASQQVLKDFSGTLEQNIRLHVQQKARLDEIGKSLKEQKAAHDSGAKSMADYTKDIQSLVKEQQQLKQANGELSQSIKAEIQEINAAGSSYDEMSARLGRLQAAYKSLSAADRGGEAGGILTAEIQVLDAALGKIDAAMVTQQSNITSYSGALKVLETALAEVQDKLQQHDNGLQFSWLLMS